MNLGHWLTLVLSAVVAALASAVLTVDPATAQTSAASTARAPVAPSSQTFGFNGGTQTFTVPDGVHQIHLTAWGGSGGNGGARPGLYAAPGGLGAEINLDAAVDPGETLLIQVGGRGEDAPGQ